MAKKKLELALYRSYLAAVENSVGSHLFRNQYYHIGRKVVDVLEDGDLSCAVYVTAVLYLFGLIKKRHTTVRGTIEDMEKSGWRKVRKPRPGAVILWDFKKNANSTKGKHRHVGFYINNKAAISSSSSKRMIARHHPTYGTLPSGEPCRDVLAYYWNDELDKVGS